MFCKLVRILKTGNKQTVVLFTRVGGLVGLLHFEPSSYLENQQRTDNEFRNRFCRSEDSKSNISLSRPKRDTSSIAVNQICKLGFLSQ